MKREIEQTEAVLLEEILYVIFRRKLLIIALLLIAGGILVYGALTKVDVYRAEAIVMIRRLPLSHQMPAESRSVLKRAEVVNSEIAIITSPAVAEEIVDSLGLGEGQGRARAIHNVQHRISAQPEPESNIIKLSYSDREAERAAEVTNAALDAYLKVRARVALDYGAVDYLDRQAQRIKAVMDSIGAEIERHGAERGQLFGAVQSEQHMIHIHQFRKELRDLDSSIYAREEKLALAEEWLASGGGATHAPSGDIYEMGTVRHVKLKYLEVRARLGSAQATYTRDHPEVKRLERELAFAEELVGIEIGQALLRQKMELEEYRAERRATARILAGLEAQNPMLSHEKMQMRVLEHELKIRNDLYVVVMNRREQFRITAATDPSLLNVGVVSRASVPVVPSKAGVNMTFVFAFFTLLFGLAFVFAVERMDQSLVRRSGVERELGLKVLAVVRHRLRG